ncbi:9827_t:CDS:2, partial [Diversispora eburnea]
MDLPIIKVQFPPQVIVEEIVRKQLNNNHQKCKPYKNGPIATYGNISPYTSSHSPSLLNDQSSQNYVNTNEDEFINSINTNKNISLNNYSLYSSLTPLSGQPSPYFNHVNANEDKFISPIAINDNIYSYTSSHSPLTSLLNQPPQNCVNINENEFICSIAAGGNISLNNYSPHSSLIPLSGQPSQYLVPGDFYSVNSKALSSGVYPVSAVQADKEIML